MKLFSPTFCDARLRKKKGSELELPGDGRGGLDVREARQVADEVLLDRLLELGEGLRVDAERLGEAVDDRALFRRVVPIGVACQDARLEKELGERGGGEGRRRD